MHTSVSTTLFDKVNKALEDMRNFVKEDGGDLELLEVTEDGIARVELKGSCTNCSMNNMTFKAGVEESILRSVPEIVKVEAVGFILVK